MPSAKMNVMSWISRKDFPPCELFVLSDMIGLYKFIAYRNRGSEKCPKGHDDAHNMWQVIQGNALIHYFGNE